MTITLDIPKEFVDHWKHDHFRDSLERVYQDIKQYRWDHNFTLCGGYEEETIEMLIDAFSNSEQIY